MTTKRARLTCVDCGADKSPDRHRLVQRCEPCGFTFMRAMTNANMAIRMAVQRGRLPPARTKSCVDCGSQALDWDHRDYSRPLDVQPVCRSCNQRRGPALYERATPAEPARQATA